MPAPQRDRERDRRIVEMYLSGYYTLAEIGGLEGGISRERVRQIVRRCGVTTEMSEGARRLAGTMHTECHECGESMKYRCVRERRKFCSRECFVTWHARHMRIWDEDKLLAHLRGLARKIGRTPSVRDLTAASPPSHMHYYEVFGSLRQAQKLAGLKPNRNNRDRSTWETTDNE